ncbi:universal stress protein [Streptomyces glaucosporus]|uniref:Universal stress protein n=1 Tax=Streptomyces glaucosporus TaxID=284044 RepID=A0ABP5V1N0_9ACTN
MVGVDPDPSRRSALAWAADEADRRGLPLRLVHARGMTTSGYWSGEFRTGREQWEFREGWEEAARDAGERVLEDAAAFARRRRPRLEVSRRSADGHPAWVLREQARDAAMAVVGSRHLSRTEELLGSASVSLPLAAHAPCPVAVVPEPEHTARQPAHFVVGVDGSPDSAAAIDFAFEAAALRGAELRALCVWRPPLLGALSREAAEQEGRRVLSESLDGPAAARPEVEVRQEFVRGHPVQVLAEASAHALGLVVGSRGRGGFAGMLLGSVSQGVLRHARCPVLVVPASGGRAA